MPDESYTPTSYSSEEGVVAGHSQQFIPGGYLSAVIHTALAGIEPTTFHCKSDALPIRLCYRDHRQCYHHHHHRNF